MLKMAKLEFENHKNQYFSWLLRSEQVKTNIFGNRVTKLTIYPGQDQEEEEDPINLAEKCQKKI